MRKHVFVLTTTAAILACGAIAASAQAPGAQTPGTQQSPTTQPTPGGPDAAARPNGRAIATPCPSWRKEDSDQDDFFRYHRGMMGGGMMGPGMMGGGMMGTWVPDTASGHRGHDIVGPVMMRMMFSLMDADGDGKLSLQEFQAAHERIFKAMDANKDGFVTLEEMQDFMRGH